ncbi:alpha-glucosidase/alpha-galactosidase [Spirochaetia bacterium]|nr:alpha-glucosidase/alpha-galactosidase [Spirochaetia bacterium]
MKKITFIGAGSFGFTRTLVKDILTFPSFADAEIALMDINTERLEYITQAVNKIVKQGKYPAKVTSTTDRKKALEGADGVLITILAGGVQIFRSDIEIPKKYGIDTNVGDTRGPSGIFRFLRTAPEMMAICRDIEKYAPNAVVLNYTNPMAMLCRTMQAETKLSITGLCHSVQGTAEMLARWIGADFEKEVTYTCAGINHQAFYLEYKVNGKDAYPRIREAMKRPEVYNEEIVRNEMFKHLDYYVTESSGHNSEYNWWFRKRPELIEKYCKNGTGWNPGEYAYILNEYLKREDIWKKEIDEYLAKDSVDITRGHEYAAYIFNGIFGDNTIYRFNGNVRNQNYIDNLPAGACVEVPVYAGKDGLVPVHVGPLPKQLAILVGVSAQIEELAIEGHLSGDRRKIFHAILNDPLSAAVCSMQEISDMTDEMFAANKQYLPQFKF